MVEIIFNNFSLPELNENFLEHSISELIENEGFIQGEVVFVLLSDEEMLEHNKALLDHDFYTDVITIDQKVGNIISGEILISIDRVRENADSHGVSLLHELHRIFFHGVLHIIGYNDKTDEEKTVMTERENFYLSKLSF